MERFLIFGMPRSGTTSLAFLLGTLGKVAHEPFNERSGALRRNHNFRQLLGQWSCLPEQLSSDKSAHQGANWNRMARLVETEEACARYLDRLFTHFRGIKHTWPALSDEGNHRIIDWCMAHGVSVIFQYRKNIALAVLSAQLARQTGIWQLTGRESAKKREQWGHARFEPVNVEPFKRQFQKWSEQQTSYLKRLAGARCFKLAYEQLYEAWNWQRQRTLNRLCKHLSIAPGALQPGDVKRIMFNPNSKQTHRKTLRRIPNYPELKHFL